MIQYILEILAFQILFLIVYDLFLKGETFFQWNRFYLIGTFILSLVLPWVKIEAFKTTVSQDFIGYPVYMWQLDGVVVGTTETKTSWLASLPTEYLVFGIGVLLATIVFGYKLLRIYSLKNKGTIRYYKDFTKVVIQKSELAFSFFKHIFLGEQIKEENQANIVAHELVHIKQWHSLDLLFFELMRIAFWFNPLVYVYQKRVSELHEFIADAIVAKKNKKEQYQLLLAEVFQTQHISFINQFFKKSLIKKRIVMLSKSKSKKINQFKYLLLVPLVLGMLLYTSCEQEVESLDFSENVIQEENKFSFRVGDLNQLTSEEEKEQNKIFQYFKKELKDGELVIEDISGNTIEVLYSNGEIENISVRKKQLEESKSFAKNNQSESFSTVDEVPVFPGCENATDKKACFQESMNRHIRKNFNYPLEAQEKEIQGRVSIAFIISKEGEIKNIRKRGPHELLENEVVRIIERLPQMTPGKHKGEAVEVPFSIPISFKLK